MQPNSYETSVDLSVVEGREGSDSNPRISATSRGTAGRKPIRLTLSLAPDSRGKGTSSIRVRSRSKLQPRLKGDHARAAVTA